MRLKMGVGGNEDVLSGSRVGHGNRARRRLQVHHRVKGHGHCCCYRMGNLRRAHFRGKTQVRLGVGRTMKLSWTVDGYLGHSNIGKGNQSVLWAL